MTFRIFLRFPLSASPQKIRLKAVLSAEFRTFVFHQFRTLSTAHVRFVRFLHGMRVRMRLMLVSSAASGETRSGAARRRNQIGPPGLEPRRSSCGATEPAVSERQYSGRLTGFAARDSGQRPPPASPLLPMSVPVSGSSATRIRHRISQMPPTDFTVAMRFVRMLVPSRTEPSRAQPAALWARRCA